MVDLPQLWLETLTLTTIGCYGFLTALINWSQPLLNYHNRDQLVGVDLQGNDDFIMAVVVTTVVVKYLGHGKV